jgi:F-type H+-transporting ATPase subunit delta
MSRKQSSYAQIADRYASALFALASEKRVETAVLADLQVLKQAIETTPEAVKFLAHPLIARAKKAEMLGTIVKARGAHALTQSAIAILAEAGRLPVLPALADAFAKRLHGAAGAMEATVTTARALDGAAEKAIAHSLEAASGKKVVLSLRQDATLIGGLKVKMGAVELDASIAGKLARLKQTLKAA